MLGRFLHNISLAAEDRTTLEINFEDLLGFSQNDRTLELHSYPHHFVAGCTCGTAQDAPASRQYRGVELLMSSAAQAAALLARIQSGLRQTGYIMDPQHPRKWLVIVSNASGKGGAGRLYSRVWKPMMLQAGVQPTEIVTEDQTHSTRIAQTLLAEEYDAVVCAGGDGLLYEVINGVMARDDWQQLLSRLDFGILPGGSGNGVVTSLCSLAGEACSPVSACFLLLKRQPGHADLASVMHTVPTRACNGNQIAIAGDDANKIASGSTANSNAAAGCNKDPVDAIADIPDGGPAEYVRQYSLMGVMHGVVGDLDIESENLRCLGAERFTAQAIVRSVWHRQYSSKVWYIPADTPETTMTKHPRVATGAADTKQAIDSIEIEGTHPQELGESDEGIVADSCGASGPFLSFGNPGSELSERWEQLEIPGGDLFFFSAAKCPFISKDNRVSCESTMQDGVWHIQLLPAANFCSAVSFLLSLDDEGSHTRVAGLQQVRAKAFRLETGPSKQFCCCAAWCTCCPTQGATQQGDRWVTVDGNPIPDTNIQGEIHPALISLLGFTMQSAQTQTGHA